MRESKPLSDTAVSTLYTQLAVAKGCQIHAEQEWSDPEWSGVTLE